jgi:methylphosphotriester-DNA--protein-cysteine methyltransferase
VNQYYLHKSASLENMSKILNISPATVNQITNTYYAMEFESLCSKYKFQHFWDEFTNPLNSELPVESIIKSAGFNSNDDFTEIILKHKEESKYILERKFI